MHVAKQLIIIYRSRLSYHIGMNEPLLIIENKSFKNTVTFVLN